MRFTIYVYLFLLSLHSFNPTLQLGESLSMCLHREHAVFGYYLYQHFFEVCFTMYTKVHLFVVIRIQISVKLFCDKSYQVMKYR